MPGQYRDTTRMTHNTYRKGRQVNNDHIVCSPEESRRLPGRGGARVEFRGHMEENSQRKRLTLQVESHVCKGLEVEEETVGWFRRTREFGEEGGI